MTQETPGFWRHGQPGFEEFNEANMDRTLLRVGSYTSLLTAIDRDGMMGYDTTYKRFIGRAGGLIYIERVLLLTQAQYDALTIPSPELNGVMIFITDTERLVLFDRDGNAMTVANPRKPVQTDSSALTEIDGEVSDIGSGDLFALLNHRHRHGSDIHIRGGNSQIDGDKLHIDYDSTNYTPSATPDEVTHVDELTSHLAGIDNRLGQTPIGPFPQITVTTTIPSDTDGNNGDMWFVYSE